MISKMIEKLAFGLSFRSLRGLESVWDCLCFRAPHVGQNQTAWVETLCDTSALAIIVHDQCVCVCVCVCVCCSPRALKLTARTGHTVRHWSIRAVGLN